MSTKGVALSFCLYHAQVLPPRHGIHLRATPSWQRVLWGVAEPDDSIQAKRRFAKFFWGWQKGIRRGWAA